jgi:GLPGLI family protein
MNHRTVRLALAVLFLFGLATSAFAQGLYWESKMTGKAIGEQTQQMWAVPKMMKGVTKETGEAYIIRLDKQIFITIDPKEKTYSEMTFAEMESVIKKASGKMDAQMAEMQKKLAEMPEEQRKMVEQMMGSKMSAKGSDAKVEVKNTTEKKTISGFSCTKVDVTQDGKEMMTLWVTKDVKEFESMRKDWQEFSTRMMDMNPMGGKGLGEAFKKIDGFPIQTEVSDLMMSTVTKVEKKVAPASEFEAPAGYKKVKPKMMEEMESTDDTGDR